MLTYIRVYTVFVSLLLNAENVNKKCFISKNCIVNTYAIKSSCSENIFKIANLKNFAYIYLKIHFNITILFHVLFLSIKCMHSIDNVVYALLNTIPAVSYWVLRYNGLSKRFNNYVCGIITGKYGNNISEQIVSSKVSVLFFRLPFFPQKGKL